MSIQSRKNFLKTLAGFGAAGLVSNLQATNQKFQFTSSVATKKRVLRIAHLTDIHVCADKKAMNGFASALHEVNQLKDKPDFIMNGGDAIMNFASISKHQIKEQWQCYHEVLQKNNDIPVHNCIGNHDLFGWAIPGNDYASSMAWTMDEYQLDKPYYSFQKNGWKFIVLNSIHKRKSIPGYFGKIDDEQLEWLKNELASTPKDVYINIVSHIPILAICILFDGSYVSDKHWFVSDNTLHADSALLCDLFFKQGNVKACLSGHIHLIDHVNYLGTDYYCNGAVSGAWWKGDHQQFSPSYILMNYFDDGSVTREVVSYDWEG